MVHHTLGDSNFGVYAEVASKFSCAQADLSCDDVDEAMQRFDNALVQCVERSRPVYVNLPSDMISKEVPWNLLDQELKIISRLSGVEVEEKKVVDIVMERIRSSQRPLIIADGLSYS